MVEYYFIISAKNVLTNAEASHFSSQTSKLSHAKEGGDILQGQDYVAMSPKVGILICNGQRCSVPSGSLLACTKTLTWLNYIQIWS